MSWLRQNWPKIASGLAILAVAAVAGWVSFAHIYELSIALHQSPSIARLMPIGIDGLVVVGSVVLLQGGRLGWLGVGPGVGLSLFANVESGLRYGPLAAIWAGIPALSFFLATFILENWAKGQAKPVAATVTAPIETPAVAPSATVTEPETIALEATADAPSGAPRRPSRTRQPVASGNDIERRAKRVLTRQPDISGADLGRAIGASPRTGQRLLARLNSQAA
jgi:hypothetical protein